MLRSLFHSLAATLLVVAPHTAFAEPTHVRFERLGAEAAQKGREENISAFLYDLRGSSNVESISANYRYVREDMKGQGLDRSSRVAMLTRPDDTSHDFIETLLVNTGYNVRIFRDEEAAVAWLEG